MITLESLDFLVSSAGMGLLAELAQADLSEAHTLTLLMRLRQQVSAEHAAALLTTARLRQKAISKFGALAERMLFTADALEQASDPLVRRYRAQRTAGKLAYDVCCGIGSDALALAEAGAAVTGFDYDPLRVALARHNAQAAGLTAEFVVRDVTQGLPDEADLLFYDPARRDEQGSRIFDVAQYQPPLGLLRDWRAAYKLAKLAPGVDLAHLPAWGGLVEFISVRGELKEALWHLAEDAPAATQTRAVLLDGALVHQWQRTTLPEVGCAAPGRWLCEPDPAILRAGLVADVAAALHGTLLDPTIAYFTTDERPASAWVRVWHILDWMPYQLKRLRAYLREHHIGRVTIKKRGFPMLPEELLAALKLRPGSEERVLVATRCLGQPIILICVPAR